MFQTQLIFDSGFIKVGHPHKLYYEQWGNPNGKPILFLHGGPGAGCSSFHKKFFDEKKYKVIFFDQRGSGKSTPYGEIINNTTSGFRSTVFVYTYYKKNLDYKKFKNNSKNYEWCF